MCSWRPWPYAATAIVQHEWDVDHLNVWVIFKYPMDQTAKPVHGLWICKVDSGLKAVTDSAWQDEWTILLTVDDVLALPARVTLEYDGPSESLRTTWNKQWEPWGPILSKRIPYLWEDILVVDTDLKRVGVQPGLPAADPFAWAFTVVSPDGNEQAGFYHDDANAWIKWSKGVLTLQTTEPGVKNTIVDLKGSGGGFGALRIYDEDYAEYWQFTCEGGSARIQVFGTNPIALDFQPGASVPIRMFSLATEGEVPKLRLYGYKTGDAARRHLDIQISPFTNNTAFFAGVNDFDFDGNIRAVGRLVSSTLTHSAVGPTPGLDVSGVNTVFIDCSANNVTISGFAGGVNGQVLQIVRLCATVNDATLQHNTPPGPQKIFLHKGADETLTGEYGGWYLVCNGIDWYDVSHAKHI